MELGFVIRFVLSRARVEAHTAKQPQMQPEHIFLGLLKAAEMFPSDFSPALTPDETEAIELDINALRESFDSRGINTKEARYLLRVEIRKGLKSPEYGYTVADILAEAARYADSEVIAAAAVLECLFKKASPFLINLFNLYESAQFDINEDELQPHVLRNKTKLRQLSDLMNKIAAMRDMLLNRVIGQDHIVRTFTEGIFNAELGLSENENSRPKSTFVFMGPPGVGKTFLAEQSAKALGVTFKRFDMSGYADRDAYHMLVGFEQTWKDSVPGILTTFVKSNPNCVLLFDEIEKAHISVIQLFLQILDAGILHDEYYAENISFSETYIIFTTNAGVSLYERDNAANAATMPKNSLLLALQTEKRPGTDDPFFPPAICSRLGIGYVLMFNKLDAKDLWHIASDKLASL
ncbi:MAG: AAA family ATPase, partial [Clostridiales bacterium]|nr:AAA family ATPase [Clostridiales bacterium]